MTSPPGRPVFYDEGARRFPAMVGAAKFGGARVGHGRTAGVERRRRRAAPTPGPAGTTRPPAQPRCTRPERRTSSQPTPPRRAGQVAAPSSRARASVPSSPSSTTPPRSPAAMPAQPASVTTSSRQLVPHHPRRQRCAPLGCRANAFPDCSTTAVLDWPSGAPFDRPDLAVHFGLDLAVGCRPDLAVGCRPVLAVGCGPVLAVGCSADVLGGPSNPHSVRRPRLGGTAPAGNNRRHHGYDARPGCHVGPPHCGLWFHRPTHHTDPAPDSNRQFRPWHR